MTIDIRVAVGAKALRSGVDPKLLLSARDR
jgi:hypothetical protein